MINSELLTVGPADIQLLTVLRTQANSGLHRKGVQAIRTRTVTHPHADLCMVNNLASPGKHGQKTVSPAKAESAFALACSTYLFLLYTKKAERNFYEVETKESLEELKARIIALGQSQPNEY